MKKKIEQELFVIRYNEKYLSCVDLFKFVDLIAIFKMQSY